MQRSEQPTDCGHGLVGPCMRMHDLALDERERLATIPGPVVHDAWRSGETDRVKMTQE